jgi:hypothetical protein
MVKETMVRRAPNNNGALHSSAQTVEVSPRRRIGVETLRILPDDFGRACQWLPVGQQKISDGLKRVTAAPRREPAEHHLRDCTAKVLPALARSSVAAITIMRFFMG